MLVLIASVFAVLLGSLQVSADETEIPFRANLILPQSQDEGIEDYVSITTDENGISEHLEFSIVNNKDKDKEIVVEIVDGYTSPGGVVQYSTEGPENSEITDENYKMSSYLTSEENIVKLKAGESKTIKLDLNIDKLDGMILGGVSFKEKERDQVDSESGNNKSDFNIKSEVNIIIGVKVDFGTEQLVEMNVGDPFIEVLPTFHVVRLPMALQNTSPKKFKFDYEVKRKNLVMFEDKMNIDFAPKSEAHIRLPWKAESIENGVTYTLKGTLTYNDLDGQEKVIDVNKDFEYKSNNYDEVIEKILSPIENANSNLIWIVILAVAVSTILLLVIREIRKSYSYYSDNREAPKFIVKGNDLYSELTKGKINSTESKYRHIYKREAGEKGDYEFIKTKVLR